VETNSDAGHDGDPRKHTYAIAFGTASTYNTATNTTSTDDDWDIDLTVSCSGSGVIHVEYAVNAICDPIGLLLTSSAAPPSRVGCRFENASSSTAAAAAALVPSVSKASVVITCVGPNHDRCCGQHRSPGTAGLSLSSSGASSTTTESNVPPQ
jgi:hypothetical protein